MTQRNTSHKSVDHFTIRDPPAVRSYGFNENHAEDPWCEPMGIYLTCVREGFPNQYQLLSQCRVQESLSAVYSKRKLIQFGYLNDFNLS